MPSLKKVRQSAWVFYQKWRKEIILASTTIQNITYKGDQKFYALEAIIEEERKIRVIIKEDLLGNKIFYSVMDRRNRKYKKSGMPHPLA